MSRTQLPAGEYVIVQDPRSDGWHVTQIDCDVMLGDFEQPDFDADEDTRTTTVDLRDGEHVECTYVNEFTPPATPTTAPPAFDLCANIEGAQNIVPVGLTLSGGNCIVAVTPAPAAATPIFTPPSTGDAGLR